MKNTIILVLVLVLAGCGRVSESTLNEVLEKDPSFKKILDAKKRANDKIASLREEILSLRKEIEPAAERLKAQLEAKYSEYRLKRKGLRDSVSKLKNIKHFLEKKDALPLSADEISVWKRRLANLENEINGLKQDLVSLQERIRLLKTEIKILKK